MGVFPGGGGQVWSLIVDWLTDWGFLVPDWLTGLVGREKARTSLFYSVNSREKTYRSLS